MGISRAANRLRARLNWADHNARFTDGEFRRFYRMNRATFAGLCDLLRPDLQRDEAMAQRGSPGGAIAPELQLSIALRFFAGGSYLDICAYHGVQKGTLYVILWRVTNSINARISLCFPHDDVEALTTLSNGFRARMNNPLAGCVGALDGIAIEIKRPSAGCKNSRSFYNRKGFFAYPLQAMCDSKYRFLFASCKCTGSTHDSVAFSVSALGQMVARGELPDGFWIAADEAYAASNSVLTPWPGRELAPERDSFNYWLSSSRIHIEQAFGILVARWGILWRPLDVDYRRVPTLMMALLKLHNLCIDSNDVPADRHPNDRRPGDAFNIRMQGACDDQPELRRGRRRDLELSTVREQWTRYLADSGIVRPQHAIRQA
jgi:hypothetical protein